MLLQYKYIADGWLGIMVGSRLWFDLSKEESYQSSVQNLIRELGNRGKVQASGTHKKYLLFSVQLHVHFS